MRLKDKHILELLNKMLLFAMAFLSIANINIFKNISYFDVLIILYVLIGVFTFLKVKINKTTLQFIVLGNLAVLLSIVFIVFSNNLIDSLFYLAQFWFIITILPVFFEILLAQNKFRNFARYYFISFLLISGGFLLFGVLHFGMGFNKFWIYKLAGFQRISFGDSLVSNDLGIILATGFLLIFHFVKNRFLRFLLLLIVSIAYLLTLSKTILLISAIFWIFYFRKKLLVMFVFFAVLFVFLAPYITHIEGFNRLTTLTEGGGGRMRKIYEILQTPSVFFIPLHGEDGNDFVKLNYGAQSVHNFILNLFVNIGIIQSIIILIPSIFIYAGAIIKRNKGMLLKLALLVIFLQIVVLSLNAFMLTRAVWIAIFLVIFYYRFMQSRIYLNESTSSN